MLSIKTQETCSLFLIQGVNGEYQPAVCPGVSTVVSAVCFLSPGPKARRPVRAVPAAALRVHELRIVETAVLRWHQSRYAHVTAGPPGHLQVVLALVTAIMRRMSCNYG